MVPAYLGLKASLEYETLTAKTREVSGKQGGRLSPCLCAESCFLLGVAHAVAQGWVVPEHFLCNIINVPPQLLLCIRKCCPNFLSQTPVSHTLLTVTGQVVPRA